MSSSTVYAIDDVFSCTTIAEYKNSWGSAPVIWKYLFEKYIQPNLVDPEWANFLSHSKEVFALYETDLLQEWEKICLALTFDYALIRKQDVEKICESLYEMWKNTFDCDSVNHLQKLVKDLQDFYSEEDNSNYYIGFYWNSIVDDFWYEYKAEDKKHWFILEEI